MACVKVVSKLLAEEEAEKLAVLLQDAGCPIDQIELVEDPGQPDPECLDEVIVVLLSPLTCADAGLDQSLAKAQNGARRVICIWPENAGEVVLPSAAKKYSYSTIPWSAAKLQAALIDDDITCFEYPTGDPIPKEEVERNLCVDEEGKPK